MAKNRNSKKSMRNGSAAMDIATSDQPSDSPLPQAMDTSETYTTKHSPGGLTRKLKKGVQMKRTKNVRKMKAIAKAVSLNEKIDEKILKNDSKTQRIKSAKNLYD